MELDPMSSPTTAFCFAEPNIRLPLYAPLALISINCGLPGGYCCLLPCDWRILRTIQRSSTDLRNFHRLPNLNAGTRPSHMYRYSVSAETPRYWEACRRFMTSR